MVSAVDPAAARPGPRRRADRGARQRVARAAVGRRRRRATASRSSRWPGSSTRRAARSSRSTSSVCSQAWTGEPFEWRGRTRDASRRSRPPQPHPMVLVGGGVPAAARRAARLRLPMLPMNTDQVVRDAYSEEAEAGRLSRGSCSSRPGPTFVHVADDPEQAWAEIGDVRALRGADLRVVPDAGSALDAGRATPRRSTTSSRRRSSWSARRTQVRGPARAGAGRRRHHVQPARRRPAARPRVGEPRAVRGRTSCRTCGRRAVTEDSGLTRRAFGRGRFGSGVPSA